MDDGFDRTIAKATRASIRREDHGILTVDIQLDYGGSGQGIPGYALDGWDKDEQRRVGHAKSIEFIAAIMEAFGVDRFEDITGRTIYALHEKGKSGFGGGYIVGLEPLPTERGERVVFADAARTRDFLAAVERNEEKDRRISDLEEQLESLRHQVEYVEGVLARDPFNDVQREFAAELLRDALRGGARGKCGPNGHYFGAGETCECGEHPTTWTTESAAPSFRVVP